MTRTVSRSAPAAGFDRAPIGHVGSGSNGQQGVRGAVEIGRSTGMTGDER